MNIVAKEQYYENISQVNIVKIKEYVANKNNK